MPVEREMARETARRLPTGASNQPAAMAAADLLNVHAIDCMIGSRSSQLTFNRRGLPTG